jgi:hypothetical protein
MNKLNSAALLAVGLFAGIGLSAVVLIGAKLPQQNQVAESQPVAGPITVQQTRLTQQTTAQSVVQPVATTPASVPAVPQSIPFEQLSPCDQLDSVARAGKSVSEFLVVAHQVNDLAKYKAAVSSTCPWNNEQLAVAGRIINPPIVAQPSVVRQSSGGSGTSGGISGGSTIVIRERPAPAWNNCNGVQEPGESYSARCETAQELNDAGLGNRWSNRVDNRPRSEIDPGWHTGRQGSANGYSGRP